MKHFKVSPLDPIPPLVNFMTRSSTIVLVAAMLLTSHANSSYCAEPNFKEQILPLLTTKCGKCHSDKTQKAQLNLLSVPGLQKGGESGAAFVAGDPDESLIWQMIDAGEMPPKGQPALTAVEKRLFKTWIKTSKGFEREYTQHDVYPYFYTRCVVCHGSRMQKGDLDLRSVKSMLKGGKSGPAIVAGNPKDSLILKKIHAKEMPPGRELIRAGVRPMEPAEIKIITQWIAQGAREFDLRPDVQRGEPDTLVTDADRDFWAFKTPLKSTVPQVKSARRRTDIDAFLLRKLHAKNLDYSPDADRVTLIRRVAFDLTGLPPDWSDIERFKADKSNDWYNNVVDFYLASSHYGERWGRYWLDVSGYADSEGKRSADPIRAHAWRYRDYVIQAFNKDKPYNRFLLEQIAGDELFDFENAKSITPDMMDAIVATGFLRMAPDGTGSDIVNTVAERFEVVADEIEILGSSVLGLTLKCAQCHSHKYDPIPHRDYYRLVSTLQGAYDVYDWLKPTSVPGQSKAKNPSRRYVPYVTEEIRAAWKKEYDALLETSKIAKIEFTKIETAERQKSIDRAIIKIPEEHRDDVRGLLKVAAKNRTAQQKQLAAKFQKSLTFKSADLLKKSAPLKKQKVVVDAAKKASDAKLAAAPTVRALWDRGEPSPTYIFRRGEYTNPGTLVGPGVLSVLTDGKTPFLPESDSSKGRRLALAKWLTDPKHPLTARVFVNRVWYRHFGRGIVESLANFGRTGSRPSHPELLDWLTVGFMENGWSTKWLHRQIMLSTAYRQSSSLLPDHDADSHNALLSRMPMKRLEAEIIRDSLLSVSGRIDKTSLGEPDPVEVRADGLVTTKPTEKGWRRTIYVLQRRKEILSILEAFDLPQMIPNCVQRPNSTVASQALHLLNNKLIRDLSVSFANRIEEEVKDDRYAQVQRIYQIALSRNPSEKEKQLALETLSELTLAWEQRLKAAPKPDEPNAQTRALANFCHVVMNSAEFLFVD
jgi:hypothetical protein